MKSIILKDGTTIDINAEQRLFLSAIARETKVCKAIDTDKFVDTNIRLLTPMIENIERKVKAVLF